MIWLRQSTASQEVLIGPFLDDTDGKTFLNALTIANTDIKIFKNGASGKVAKNSGGATFDSDGDYVCTLDATDTNTIGPGTIRVSVAGALPIKVSFTILSAAVFDVLFGTVAPSTHDAAAVQTLVAAGTVAGVAGNVTGNLGGNVTGTVGGVVGNVTGNLAGNVTGSVGSVAAAGITAGSFATGAIDGNALAGNAATEIAAAAWDLMTSGHTTTGSFGALAAAAASAGDPWATILPGSYPVDSAGYILGGAAAPSGVTIEDGGITPASFGAGSITAIQSGLALATQIPAHFTDATFVSAGVFSTGALANAPTGGGGGSDPWETVLPGSYPPDSAGYILGGAAAPTGVDINVGGIPVGAFADNAITAASLATDAVSEISSTVHATGVTVAAGGITPASFAANAVNAAALATDAVNEIANAVNVVGGADWTSTEREQIRYRLGVDGTASAPTADGNLELGDASITSAKFAVSPLAPGVPSGHLEYVNTALAKLTGMGMEVTRNRTTGTISSALPGGVVVMTQAATDDGTIQVMGNAS